MFNKILIANRGEIACRVMATARKLGVKTVAVFSDADRHSKHVSMADESIHIGAAPVADSYLQADRIVQAAITAGAEAIHPGYGFLSENPDFVRKVEAAGLVFIGPSATAIEAMGLKDAAKALMVDAGVPVVPGYHGDNQDPEFLAQEALKVGFPVLIKARAGGGGKGMRLVEQPDDFSSALAAAQREGQASFGDPVCLIEKYISQPRHIEIQVFGDNYGNVVHLFERDCSLQRRHQKVIEEAPAPDMPPAVRQAMGQAAVEAAKVISYSGAGTVEFIVDGSDGLVEDGFWFMEMNTRLQVEHPVSEAITGLDFVELQLRVAANEKLPFEQQEVKIDGWAFEARLYAEDVPNGFLPATGSIDHLYFPISSEFEHGNMRIDSGVREGDEITPYYDPMIAKIIVHGDNRRSALTRLRYVLSESEIGGSVTNIEFLSALSKNRDFANGKVDTNLITRDRGTLVTNEEPGAELIACASIMSLGLLPKQQEGHIDNWNRFLSWRHWVPAQYQSMLYYNDVATRYFITPVARDTFEVTCDGDSFVLEISHNAGSLYNVQSGLVQEIISLVGRERCIYLFHEGRKFEFVRHDPFHDQSNGEVDGGDIVAPMPGLVNVVSVAAGQKVVAGDSLLVLEAMKMEHSLTAPRDGVISEVLAEVGDQVTDGSLLIKFKV